MEWQALPHNVGFDFDVDTNTGYLTRFVVAPGTHGGEWAGLLRYFGRENKERVWQLRKTYLDVEAEFVSCRPHLLSEKNGGVVLHLLSKSGKRGCIILTNVKLAEVDERAKNYSAVTVDKLANTVYCCRSGRNERPAALDCFDLDGDSSGFGRHERQEVTELRRITGVCLQSKTLCLAGYDAEDRGRFALLKVSSMKTWQTKLVDDPANLWFDLECDPVHILQCQSDKPLQLVTRKNEETANYSFNDIRDAKMSLKNDKFGRLYAHISSFGDNSNSLFGPLELLFVTFDAKTAKM